MQFRSLQEAEAALQPFIPSVAEITGQDITLERMWPMMKILGNPEKKLKIVHIAGTSGKTSTAYYMSALLHAAGKNVALHVSPHIDKVTERTQINGTPISDELFCQELGEFLDIIYKYQLKPTYFELHTAFSYWLFERQKVDYVVMETGMGGLHDSTNVAQDSDKICIITDIGIDHTRVLGKTIPKISTQKAGIIHAQNQVYMYEQSTEIMKVFNSHCQKVKADLHTTTESKEKELVDELLDSELPLFQQRNWLLAYYTFRAITRRDNLPHPNVADLRQTQKITIPARMDIRQVSNSILIMDGAHNEQKMQTFVKSFQAKFPNKKAAILLALKNDKDFQSVVDALLPVSSQFITTTFDTSQDLPVISMDSKVLAEYCKKKGIPVIVKSDHHEAYQALLALKQPISIITGSFYLIYQIREREHLA